MPVYEYQCTECGKEQDRTFRMAEKPKEFEDTCEGCKQQTMLKSILSPTGISGFNDVQSDDRPWK